MSVLFVIALILFILGAVLVAVPDGRLFKAGLALVLLGVFFAVFLPGLMK